MNLKQTPFLKIKTIKIDIRAISDGVLKSTVERVVKFIGSSSEDQFQSKAFSSLPIILIKVTV